MKRRTILTLLSISITGAACSSAAPDDATASRGAEAYDGRAGNAYVNFHRDRLLDGYAAYKGMHNRVEAWNSLNAKQKDLFLIHTDLLGNRSYMVNDDKHYVVDAGRRCAGSYLCDSGCYITSGGANEYCNWVSTPQTCVNDGACQYQTLSPRTDFTMALEHVAQLYEILAPNGNCGGDDNNRSFWRADDALVQDFRNYPLGLPEWDENGDLGGPHPPFTNASSTVTGRPFACDGPDGQAQFYSYDSQASAFWRGSAYLPADGHMFELDDDYDLVHNSSPECDYCGGQYGRTMYENHWCSRQGNLAPCDWTYQPTPVTPIAMSFTANGRNDLMIGTGGWVTYAWNVTGATQVTSTVDGIAIGGVATSADHCGNHTGQGWVASSTNGSVGAQVAACQANTTYHITIDASNASNRASAGVYVRVP